MSSALRGGDDDDDSTAPSESASDGRRNKPWHRRPTITPNFGKRQKIGLKSNVAQVLLHDNVSQQQLLDAQLSSLRLERERTTRLLDLHKKAFLVRQSAKQHHLRATGITHVSLLPDSVARALGPGSSFRRRPVAARELTFVLGHRLDENNNDDDDGGGGVDEENGSESSNSDAGSGRRAAAAVVEDGPTEATVAASSVALPPSSSSAAAAATKALQARSHSAAVPVEDAGHFLTHDYHLRRERTALGPLIRTEPLQQRKARTLGALKDPRYVSLRKALVPSSRPVDGYLQLSASGQYVLQRYGTPSVDRERIQKLIREMTWIRQSRHRLSGGTDSALPVRSGQVSASERDKFPVDRLVIKHDCDGTTDTYEEH